MLISTVTFIISTADELQKVTIGPGHVSASRHLQDEAGNVQYPVVVFVIEMIDNFVVIFFTIEMLVRLIICPNKTR